VEGWREEEDASFPFAPSSLVTDTRSCRDPHALTPSRPHGPVTQADEEIVEPLILQLRRGEQQRSCRQESGT